VKILAPGEAHEQVGAQEQKHGRAPRLGWRGDGFESKTQSSGIYRHTFDAPGSDDYRCTLHSGMKGRVVVTGS
jgi:plastocyanin